MTKETFREDLHMSPANKERLQVINNIIEEYSAQNYRLTLRQLYYQLVSRDVIPNKPEEYAKLSILLGKGRMSGFVDWDAIEDRVRIPQLPYWVLDVPNAIDDTIRQYRLNRQHGQDNYIEVWVEKDALSGVLKRVTNEYHVNLMVNRGYSSITAMHDAYKRFARAERMGQSGIILYLGDHDPSGVDMIRDISSRLEEFGVSVDVNHIALTDEQIQSYNPPPNPTRVSDPRAKSYIEKYGHTSWEVDALRPGVLHKLVVDSIEDNIDMNLFEEQKEQEQKDIKLLKRVEAGDICKWMQSLRSITSTKGGEQ
jgi:hypothetical protein